MGLLTDCPFEHALFTCPFKGFRVLSMKERFRLSRQMGENQIDAMVSHHCVCMRERNLEQL